MNIFANISIKYKLALLALLPLLGLIYFSASNIQEKYNIEQQMTAIQELSQYAVKASALVHETQKERGATAGYLGSKGTKFKTELPAQRNETNIKISELKEFLIEFNTEQYGREYVRTLNDSMNRLGNISNIRSSVTGLTISAKDAIGYYTKMNAAFLNSISLIAKIAENGAVVRESTAYINYLMGKERAGIERAVMANTFARDNFGKGMYQKFGNLVSQQATYANVFKSLASEEQKSFYNNKMSGDAIQQVKQMRAAAHAKAADGNFGVNATAWFRAATARINLLKEVENKLSEDIQSLATRLQSEAEQFLAFYMTLTIVVLAIVIIAVFAFTRSIIGPLGTTLVAMEDIAEGEGDLTRRLNESGKDEIAQVAQAFNKFTKKIKGVVIDVKETAESIASGSQQISAGNTNLSQRTEEQASSLEETASSMEEMTSTVKQNADSANEAQNLADSNRQLAIEGVEVVERTVTAMNEINTSSSKIAEIISTIDGIAFQTNLLALNAAVEAARAGEQGRGFAVVASEVRTLAQRSADAAKEIKTLIGDSVGKVKAGTMLVDESGKTLEEITEGIKQVASIVSEIAASSREQAGGIEQVNTAITQMDDMTQQNAALVEEAAAASRSMQQQASNMIDLMSYFKVEEQNSVGMPKRAKAPEVPVTPAKTQPLKRTGTDNKDWENF